MDNDKKQRLAQLIESIDRTAPLVARLHSEHSGAKLEARRAEADLLRSAVDQLRPALAAVTSRVEAENTHKRDARGVVPFSQVVTYFEGQGLCLGQQAMSARQSSAYWLFDDGSFMLTDRKAITGAPGGNGQRIVGYTQTIAPCSAEDVIAALGVETPIQAMADALLKQARRVSDTEEAHRHAVSVQELVDRGNAS